MRAELLLKPLLSRTASRSRVQLSNVPITWSLPGGGVKGLRCGEVYFLGCLRTDNPGHDGLAYVRPMISSCDKRECPTDWQSWLNKRTQEATKRILFGMSEYHKKVALHVVVSPPQDSLFYTLADYRRLRSKAIAALKYVGYKGGTLVFHPWRCRNFNGSPIGGARLQTDGIAIWSPHFHAIVLGWNENTAALYRDTGWLVMRKSVLRSESQIAAKLRYILHHCGCGEAEEKVGRTGYVHALTWYGSMDYRSLKMPLELDEIFPCPLCQAPMYRVEQTNPQESPHSKVPKRGMLVAGSGWRLDLNGHGASRIFQRIVDEEGGAEAWKWIC